MRYSIFTFLLGSVVTSTAGCGFHLLSATQIPHELRMLLLQSDDPYSQFTRMVHQQLLMNYITVINNEMDNEDIATNSSTPTLRLSNEHLERNTALALQNGMVVEYSMVMSVNAQVVIPQKGIYPISASIYRFFFDNLLAPPLAKNTEQDIILDEMRQLLAEQLVHTLVVTHAIQLNNKTTLSTLNMIAPEENLTEISSSSTINLR